MPSQPHVSFFGQKGVKMGLCIFFSKTALKNFFDFWYEVTASFWVKQKFQENSPSALFWVFSAHFNRYRRDHFFCELDDSDPEKAKKKIAQFLPFGPELFFKFFIFFKIFWTKHRYTLLNMATRSQKGPNGINFQMLTMLSIM